MSKKRQGHRSTSEAQESRVNVGNQRMRYSTLHQLHCQLNFTCQLNFISHGLRKIHLGMFTIPVPWCAVYSEWCTACRANAALRLLAKSKMTPNHFTYLVKLFSPQCDSNVAFPLFSGYILAYCLMMDSLLFGFNCTCIM